MQNEEGRSKKYRIHPASAFFILHLLPYGTTIRARCAETVMRAMLPPLNSRKSDSTPSEKMTPPEDICDSTTSSSPSFKIPKTNSARDVLLTNGSRTAQASWRSSQVIWGAAWGFSPNARAMPPAMLKTLDSQPVDPAPVATIMPLDDCASLR